MRKCSRSAWRPRATCPPRAALRAERARKGLWYRSAHRAEHMIFVTGGCGFIGSCFVLDWLEQEDEPILNLDALTYAGHLGNLAPVERHARYHFVRGDIRDRALFASLLEKWQPRAIVHFAAETH